MSNQIEGFADGVSLAQASAQHVPRFLELVRSDVRLQHSVLEDFALGVAASNADETGKPGMEPPAPDD